MQPPKTDEGATGRAAPSDARGRFGEALERELGFAGLSPSSHNSQPWGVASLESEQARAAIETKLGAAPAFAIAVDERRAIRALPSLTAEMHVSLGMFLHVLVLGLAAEGWESRVGWSTSKPSERFSFEGWPPDWRPLAVLTAEPRDPEPIDRTAIIERVTNRAPYTADRIPESQRNRLIEAQPAFSIAGGGDLSVTVIDDVDLIRGMADFVEQHAAVDFAHREAWAETYRYVRFSPSETAEAEDGFSVEQLFGPLARPTRKLLQLALSPVTMRLLSKTPVPIVLAKGLADLVRTKTPAMAVFSFASEEPPVADQLLGGARAMSFWLEATRLGLAMHPVSVILQHPEIRLRFQDDFGLPGRVFFFARLGHPTASFPRTPRRQLSRDGFMKV